MHGWVGLGFTRTADAPTVQGHHRLAKNESECNLAEGAVPPADGDDRVAGADDQGVAQVAHTGGNRDAYSGCRVLIIIARKQADARPSGCASSVSHGRRHTITAAAHDQESALR